MKKIEHIGIAVKDMQAAEEVYSSLLGVAPYKREMVKTEHVLTSFFKVGNSKIELLESSNDSGPVAKFIKKRGEGMHHIAFEVENIEQEMERLRNAGFQLLSEKPKAGADNKLVCFVHPKSAHGVLVELCQERK